MDCRDRLGIAGSEFAGHTSLFGPRFQCRGAQLWAGPSLGLELSGIISAKEFFLFPLSNSASYPLVTTPKTARGGLAWGEEREEILSLLSPPLCSSSQCQIGSADCCTLIKCTWPQALNLAGHVLNVHYEHVENQSLVFNRPSSELLCGRVHLLSSLFVCQTRSREE